MTTSFEIPEHLQDDLKMVLPAGQSVSQFAKSAFEEKINRAIARDERAKRQKFEKDIESFRPIVLAILKEANHG